MFHEHSFSEACELYTDIRRALLGLEEIFGQAGMECIVDALHVYAHEGHALDCSGFDEDFAHLFTLAYRDWTGHDLKPEFSCLTDWDGAIHPLRRKHEPHD